jgi:hypothetical protein
MGWGKFEDIMTKIIPNVIKTINPQIQVQAGAGGSCL